MTLTRRHLLATPAAVAAGPAAAQQSRISLAAWSFSQSFFRGKWKLLELPRLLREKLSIGGLEHVNTFFENPTLGYLQKLKRACSDNGVQSLIVMVDDEGNTASPDAAERKQSAVAHRKWIDIAQHLGCHSVRCNLRGGAAQWKQDAGLVDRAAETFHSMLAYAKDTGLNIIVENHGGASSDPDVLVSLVKKINHPKFGLLCDLGNWNPGDDRYAAVRKTIPYARGLSVKGTWGAHVDPAFDAEKLLRTARDAGYAGWWGIEVTPRNPGAGISADDLLAREVKTVLEAKALTGRVLAETKS